MRESRYNVPVERGDRVWVYNGLSGQIRALPSDEWRDVRRFLAEEPGRVPDVDALRDLTLGRMLVNDETDELDILEHRYRTATSDRTSFSLTIVTSLGCNFDCPYCFEAKVPSILGKEVQDLVLKLLDDKLPNIKSFNVVWYGGEPLVGKKPLLDLSDDFIDRCDRA